jgi:inner membrane transporter RhtA
VLWALGAAVGWAAYIVFGRAAGAAYGTAAAPLSLGVAAVVILPIGIAQAGWALLDPAVLPLALGLAVLSGAAPFALELYAMPRLPARTFATFTSLEPAFSVLSGLILLHERLGPLQLAGVALVIAAAGGAAWSSAARTAQAA